MTVARVRSRARRTHGGRRRCAHLAVLVDLFDRGLREPLPLYCKTSAAYAAASPPGSDGRAAAERQWESDRNFPEEDSEPEHQLVLGGTSAVRPSCSRAAARRRATATAGTPTSRALRTLRAAAVGRILAREELIDR